MAIRQKCLIIKVLPIALVSLITVAISSCTSAKGDSGVGDPYNPELGNGGYDVNHYDIVMAIDPLDNFLSADVTIHATTTQSLKSFNLDFGRLSITSLEVNGLAASYSQEDNEITITLGERISVNESFTVNIKYEGVPKPKDSFINRNPVGWFHSPDGTINIMNWPDGQGSWFPGNHHQSDKATFRFDISLPEPWKVAAPGNETEYRETNGDKHYVFEMDVPMASVSAVLYIDDYDVTVMEGPAGVKVKTYVPKNTDETLSRNFHDLAAMIEYFEKLFGKYPFKQYTVVIADSQMPMCQGEGSANGEQTLSVHCPSFYVTSQSILAHEISHQWFGISVTPLVFKDSWLAEGPATYAEWLWNSRENSSAMDRIAEERELYYVNISHPSVPIGVPPEGIITDAIYTGGGILLHSLRKEVGDELFFNILQEYQSRYKYSNATTSDFINIAEEVSGRDLKQFFDSWLYEIKIPPKN